MDVDLLEQFPADGLARAAFKEHVFGQNDGGATMLLEDCEDVLEKIELLVARRGPEVIPVDDERLPFWHNDGICPEGKRT